MHTYEAKNGAVFRYDSDFGGRVEILQEDPDSETLLLRGDIAAQDLLEFVAYCYVLGQRISKVEDMSAEELLG